MFFNWFGKNSVNDILPKVLPKSDKEKFYFEALVR